MDRIAEQINEVDAAVSRLNEIQGDNTVPRNVRIEIQSIVSILKDGVELPIKVNKALNHLDEISNDINLQSYTRMQIWNVISLLEKLY